MTQRRLHGETPLSRKRIRLLFRKTPTANYNDRRGRWAPWKRIRDVNRIAVGNWLSGMGGRPSARLRPASVHEIQQKSSDKRDDFRLGSVQSNASSEGGSAKTLP
ncbi:hypothetical protein EVAR_25181_1 [Eumeta japonica]|uniref:Uncharacterized protein n=1 Tax=Eumeta variegata TaxID=151549 RepID=A0A4C1VSJ3_EUMVA|nr:hypothetical protein EVAR_25181_1 [Eumeta japonica]